MIPLLPNTGAVQSLGITAMLAVIIAGALGALIREMIDNNGLKLPSIKDGFVSMGFIGGTIIGAVAGFYLGDSAVGAFTAGLSANAIIQGIITRTSTP